MSTVEVRCPIGPKKLFTKLKLGEEFATILPGSNLIEFTCRDCAKRMARETGQSVRVFHRFNFFGELIETTAQELPSTSPGTA